MGLKKAFLNRGWAGRTISRQATIERLNPLIKMHHELNHAYHYAINHVSSIEVAARLEALLKTGRADIGKLSESVLSAGGVPYSGVDLEPEAVRLSDEEGLMLDQLKESEESFHQGLSDELSEEHQIRTQAILSVVRSNSAARLDYLRDVARKYRRTNR